MKKAILVLLLAAFGCTSIHAQKWHQFGFKLGTTFSINKNYSYEDKLEGLANGEFGVFFRAGKFVYAEIGVGYAFYKGTFTNNTLGLTDQKVETRHIQVPVKLVGNVQLGRKSAFLPFVGVIYQPVLQVTNNNLGYSKKTLNTNQTLLTAGFDMKFGPIILGVNYRYSLLKYFENKDGDHPQFINICAGFQF